MKFPEKITVVDVSPRDGLQSLPKWIPTETKVKMIDRLSQAGYPVIEVSGFGSERALPMLKDPASPGRYLSRAGAECLRRQTRGQRQGRRNHRFDGCQPDVSEKEPEYGPPESH
jgi:isopropylmalate/homocitrate/citramalate synthase